jgi:hypothetical protein
MKGKILVWKNVELLPSSVAPVCELSEEASRNVKVKVTIVEIR